MPCGTIKRKVKKSEKIVGAEVADMNENKIPKDLMDLIPTKMNIEGPVKIKYKSVTVEDIQNMGKIQGKQHPDTAKLEG